MSSRLLKPFLSTWLTGLLAVLPLVMTLGLVVWVVGLLNRFVGPDSMLGRSFSVLGVFAGNPFLAWLAGTALVLAAIYVLGLVVQSRLRAPVMALLDSSMRRIPLLGRVYDVAERFVAVLGDRGKTADIAAMSPVWCSFGESGVKVLGLLPNPEPLAIAGQPHLAVLVPTAPIPVGGGLLYVPVQWVARADIGVDTLTSVYLSMGITAPVAAPGGRRRAR
ncbi:DUF502 domain-containing protein [Lysobacter sp. GX 14042]|uniref:DUF502 domain-containing protein n=1 Tax=Lysobacter sp. GX 14042 TaxID=2907155 RepID=UPI001F3D71F0|nr:DUF502 domain-containing protein [Lysobacter sp. GX 14042]MCE7032951.1 DUF502 domain-containing protein [Lysobacter sp. GX 14042]